MKIDKSGPCSECRKSKQIENRTKWLCQPCNHLRRHGETIYETAQRKQREYQERSMEKERNRPKQVQKKYTIKQQTKEEGVVKNQLSILKQKIRQEAIDSELYYCSGCGDGSQNLDCSHILSVKQRKDLELDKNNINLFCRTCHNKWESGDVEVMLELNTFIKDLEYIKLNDIGRFNRLLIKIRELDEAIKQGLIFDVNAKVMNDLKKIIITENFITIKK